MFSVETKKYSARGTPIAIGKEVVNVVPSDYNHDGLLDLLVMSKGKGGLIDHQILLADKDNFVASNWKIPSSRGEPMIFDYRGTMQMSLLGHFDGGTGLEVLVPIATSPDELNTGFTQQAFQPAVDCDHLEWNAVLDLNGDGKPDLALFCTGNGKTTLHILLADAGNFKLAKTMVMPVGSTQFTFADIDGDGSPDLIYTDKAGGSLMVARNTQRPFCTGHKSIDPANCKSSQDPFIADASFGFAKPTVISLGLTEGISLLQEDPDTKQPLPLSFGDFDLDGFPDLLATVRTASGASHPVLFRNEDGKRFVAGAFPQADPITIGTGAIQAVLADIYGKGSLSILVNGHDDQGKPTLTAFTNDVYTDCFFVRAECLNGVCPSPCSRKDTGSATANPYGVNYSGASFRLSFTDPEGSIRVRYAAQLAQTGHRALQQPFAIFGLGRTNSFVELFSAGVPSGTHSSRHIIPNSDLIVIPPHADSPDSWTFQVHIHPAAYLIWVTVALAVTLSILLGLTGFFKLKERREDEAEKKRRAHAINFDAM